MLHMCIYQRSKVQWMAYQEKNFAFESVIM